VEVTLFWHEAMSRTESTVEPRQYSSRTIRPPDTTMNVLELLRSTRSTTASRPSSVNPAAAASIVSHAPVAGGT
jgi:hypothetical protein